MPDIQFTISSTLASSVDLQQLQDRIRYLGTLFGESIVEVIPTSILHPPQAAFVFRLAAKLKEVATCPRVQEHVATYRNGLGAFFVTCLAAHLLVKGAFVEFEPPTRDGRLADLQAAVADSDPTVIECKSPEGGLETYRDLHRRMFDAIEPHVNTPHVVTIRFRRAPSVDELQALAQSIERRLPNVVTDGIFLADADVEVSLDRSMDAPPTGLRLEVSLIAPDPDDNTLLPGNLIVHRGKKISFYGPVVGVADLLRDRIRRALAQAPLDLPYVLAVSGSGLLGSPKEQRIAIHGEFQPSKNTRVSGVLIADFPTTTTGEEQPNLRFFGNPFATRHIPQSLTALLSP